MNDVNRDMKWAAVIALAVSMIAGASEWRHESLVEEQEFPPLEEWMPLVTDTAQVTCAELYPPDPDREWDDELEEYVPINWDWRECMGVGSK